MNEKKVKYPERSLYFLRGPIRYYPFKTRCPNCGKVCVEDFLAQKGQKIKREPLMHCHRCRYNYRDDPERRMLVWRRVPAK